MNNELLSTLVLVSLAHTPAIQTLQKERSKKNAKLWIWNAANI